MRTMKLIGALVAFATMGIAAAQAAPGYSTVNLNLRTGPDTDFPRVDVIPEGNSVEILGCLRDKSWCDIVWDRSRGWVYSEYLAIDHRGDYVPLPDMGIAAFSIPAVRFVARDYWGRHYVGRPWYKERDRWYGFKPRPRVGWRAPPSGKRTPGWWRSGYKAPKGMKAPPGRGWHRPHRKGGPGHRDGRRHDRHDDRRHDGRHDHRR